MKFYLLTGGQTCHSCEILTFLAATLSVFKNTIFQRDIALLTDTFNIIYSRPCFVAYRIKRLRNLVIFFSVLP